MSQIFIIVFKYLQVKLVNIKHTTAHLRRLLPNVAVDL